VDQAAAEPTWAVRPVQPGDVEEVVELARAVYRQPMSAAQYRWKVLGSPWPVDAPNAFVAVDGDRVVGHYAGTPLRMKLGRHELPVFHGCDVMTDAAYRRHGVLTALGEAANAAWAGSEVAFQYALQHAGWGSRLAYLGWQVLFKAIWLARPLHVEDAAVRRFPWAAPARRAIGAGGRAWHGVWCAALAAARDGVDVEPLARPGAEIDLLWDELKSHYEATVVRDRAWLAYRYADAPGYDYRMLLARRATRPCGSLVYRLTGDGPRTTGWIMDLFTAPDDRAARAALLSAGLDDLYRAGAGSARFLVPEGVPLARELRRFGFFSSPGHYDVSMVPAKPDQPAPALRDPTRWLTMLGDFDSL
jgi:hypothetical protein